MKHYNNYSPSDIHTITEEAINALCEHLISLGFDREPLEAALYDTGVYGAVNGYVWECYMKAGESKVEVESEDSNY